MYGLVVSCGADGKNVVVYEHQCWTSEHYIHTALAALFTLILFLLVIPSTAFFFENNCSSTNAFTKVSSTADIMSLSFKAILTMALILFNNVRPYRVQD